MHRLCLAGFLALAMTSCGDSIIGTYAHDPGAIQVSVRIQPGSIVAGSPASVLLTLKNMSPRYVEISSCPIYFWVEGSGGQVVGGSRSIGCFGGSFVYQPLRFGPFEAKTFTFHWQETQSVPPGVYNVFGWVGFEQRASPPAQVTVLPAT